MGTAVKRFWMTLCAVIMWFSVTLWSVNAWAEATPSEGVAPAYKVDVVVVGSGGAGLAAALSAAEKGASVIVLEKMPMIGGNTSQASGYLIAVPETAPSKAKDIQEALLDDMLKEGGETANREKLKFVLSRSSEMTSWLIHQGADIEASFDYQADDAPVAYIPTQTSYTVGEEVIKTLTHSVEMRNIPVLTLTQVTGITTEAHHITGVVAINAEGKEITVHAKAVILATGGFGASEELISRYIKPQYRLNSTNLPGTTGDGLKLVEPFDAKLVDMDKNMVHLTTVPFSGLVIPLQARMAGGILLNSQGHRFMNELDNDVSAMCQRADGQAWLIIDQAILDRYPALGNYARSGLFVRGRTVEELARMIRVNPDVLMAELREYRNAVRRGVDERFARPSLKSYLSTLPLYAINVRPGLQSTLGGLETTFKGEVLNTHNQPIPGLYAAGEVAGGLFGNRRLEGASLTASLVYGRAAGQAAANYSRAQANAHQP